MLVGFLTLYQIQQKIYLPDGTITIAKQHFGGSAFPLSKLGFDTKGTIYAGILAIVANLVVCAVGTLVLRALKVPDGIDVTGPDDYFADRSDPIQADAPEVGQLLGPAGLEQRS